MLIIILKYPYLYFRKAKIFLLPWWDRVWIRTFLDLPKKKVFFFSGCKSQNRLVMMLKHIIPNSQNWIVLQLFVSAHTAHWSLCVWTGLITINLGPILPRAPCHTFSDGMQDRVLESLNLVMNCLNFIQLINIGQN